MHPPNPSILEPPENFLTTLCPLLILLTKSEQNPTTWKPLRDSAIECAAELQLLQYALHNGRIEYLSERSCGGIRTWLTNVVVMSALSGLVEVCEGLEGVWGGSEGDWDKAMRSCRALRMYARVLRLLRGDCESGTWETLRGVFLGGWTIIRHCCVCRACRLFGRKDGLESHRDSKVDCGLPVGGLKKTMADMFDRSDDIWMSWELSEPSSLCIEVPPIPRVVKGWTGPRVALLLSRMWKRQRDVHPRWYTSRTREEKCRNGLPVILFGSDRDIYGDRVELIDRIRTGKINDFSIQERLSYRGLIYNRLFRSLESVVRQVGISNIASVESRAWAMYLCELREISFDRTSGPLPITSLPVFRKLLADPDIHNALEERGYLGSRYGGKSVVGHFREEINRIFEANYTPTHADIARADAEPSWLRTERVSIDQNVYTFIGGSITAKVQWQKKMGKGQSLAVIYDIDLTTYDNVYPDSQYPEDRNELNAHAHGLEQLMSHERFQSSAIVIMLNRVDLFKQNVVFPVPRNSFNDFFPDFEGNGADADAALEFLKAKFIRATAGNESRCAFVMLDENEPVLSKINGAFQALGGENVRESFERVSY